MDADLALALALADVADSISAPRFRSSDLVVETKPDMSPVTEADRAVEEALRERLASERPEDVVLGEEFGQEGTGSRRWILDPIDGTKNYVRGIPIWGTLIALERDGDLAIGVASAPALGRRWWACRGAGAFADGRPIRVSRVAKLEDAQLCYSGMRTWRATGMFDRFIDLAMRTWRARGLGDFWIHVLVAEGSADVAMESAVSLWDLAAPKVIVEEAGGRFTDLSGASTAGGGSAVSTNGLLHDEVMSIVEG